MSIGAALVGIAAISYGSIIGICVTVIATIGTIFLHIQNKNKPVMTQENQQKFLNVMIKKWKEITNVKTFAQRYKKSIAPRSNGIT